MSFVKALPEAMTSAAGQLAGIGEALTAENGAALAPTTVIAPAGTDPISQLQSALFATYGSLYQSISDQAAAVHQQLVQVLGQNAGAYSSAEATNQGTTSLDAAIQGFLTDILGVPTSGSSSVLSGNAANIGNIGMGNWASAGSALLGLAGGGLLDFPEEVAPEAAGLAGLEQAVLAGSAGPAATPLAAGVAQATTVGALSTPPSWAGEGVGATSATPARLAATSMVAPQPVPGMAAVPAALPAAGSGDRGVGRFGAPRYGTRPAVVPKSKAF
ncbi:PPE family protein, SVP subgroup [[Mycobacterium] nativiensis]|uniref:PE domain-containing protein n=1 Tax=[Mycobacterium] nativiensis TaxID=2855503 RepID=A0ABU5XXZ7_9MYCO|nr:PE domain-containing protein [Mycolicibacter sp. MYC340]MEB3032662.1 PE domain-containing protein [Mycolicibacter sp. MYC340]